MAQQVDLHKRFVFFVEGLLVLFSVSFFAPEGPFFHSVCMFVCLFFVVFFVLRFC